MADAPDNASLKALLDAVLDAREDEMERAFKPLLHALIGATLITERDLSEVDVDDETYLGLFTDPIEVHFFAPGSPWKTIAAAEAIKRVAREDYDGLVINPGRRQLELSREDVLDFFEVD